MLPNQRRAYFCSASACPLPHSAQQGPHPGTQAASLNGKGKEKAPSLRSRETLCHSAVWTAPPPEAPSLNAARVLTLARSASKRMGCFLPFKALIKGAALAPFLGRSSSLGLEACIGHWGHGSALILCREALSPDTCHRFRLYHTLLRSASSLRMGKGLLHAF